MSTPQSPSSHHRISKYSTYCAESKEEPPNSEAAAKSEDPGAAIEKLDLQLTYLWKVHGVDYYAGKELSEPMQYKLRLTTPRMMRGPRPEEGEQPTEAEGGWLLFRRNMGCTKVQGRVTVVHPCEERIQYAEDDNVDQEQAQ